MENGGVGDGERGKEAIGNGEETYAMIYGPKHEEGIIGAWI